MTACDFLVIGAGMAGASAGFELAAHGRTILIERESQPGYHSTGRSAALFTETYGNATVRGLTVGSRAFLATAADTGFAAAPVLGSRGVLFVGRTDQEEALARAFDEGARLVSSVERLDAPATLSLAPMLRPDYVAGGVWEPDAMDLDVHAIHHGYLRGLRARGGSLVTDAEATAIHRRGPSWVVETTAGRFEAPILVNAAGAWADRIATLAGVPALGLTPKRRTAITFAPHPAVPAEEVARWPMVCDVDETFYFKPEGGRVLASPADETPVEPCDAQPEELDVAEVVDRVVRAVTFEVRRIAHKWAGLRTFAADRTPVAGFDAQAEGFFWLAGQGGYGIQTAPAMGRLVAALATGSGFPTDLARLGVTETALSPVRLRRPGL